MTMTDRGIGTAKGVMVVRDAAMLGVLRRIEQVATSNAHVLITGESGTGKSHVAAHLHRCGGGDSSPFVVFDCTAMLEKELEAELFGHDDGASGPGILAGKFAAARGGTLLLDGIGEMAPQNQAVMLRAIRQHETDGHGIAGSGARIVASTSRELIEEVRHGRFRTDLFFRLNVVTIKLPALRDRPSDIPALAEHFAKMFAAENGLQPMDITPAALDTLVQHTWPGNVRELANVMHRAVLTADGGTIAQSDLEIDQLPAIVPPAAGTTRDSKSFAVVNTSGRTIEAVEKDMILDTLCRCKGNRGQSAVMLGISIRTLRNKLNEYERSGTRIPRPVVMAMA